MLVIVIGAFDWGVYENCIGWTLRVRVQLPKEPKFSGYLDGICGIYKGPKISI